MFHLPNSQQISWNSSGAFLWHSTVRARFLTDNFFNNSISSSSSSNSNMYELELYIAQVMYDKCFLHPIESYQNHAG